MHDIMLLFQDPMSAWMPRHQLGQGKRILYHTNSPSSFGAAFPEVGD